MKRTTDASSENRTCKPCVGPFGPLRRGERPRCGAIRFQNAPFAAVFFATDVRRFKNCLLPLHVGNVWQTTCVAIHPNNITIMKKQEYARVNKEWLAEKANEEGVNELPGGIYYKVLKTGLNDDRHPSPRSIVTAHYTGRTINGKKFDSSLGGAPLAIRLCDLIDGWIIAMQRMCVGDKWEVYIPAEKGYGKFSQPGIPGYSTLIFEIELLGIA